MIKIISQQDGFRRCGVAHPSTATEHADDAFSKEQLKQLQAEPMLLVEIVPDKKDGKQPPAK